MRAIVPKAVLACVALACLHADTHADLMDFVGDMAAALTVSNVPQFMKAFDKEMPGYSKLEDEVKGLVDQAEITSTIEPVKDQGDEAKRTLELDWFLEIRSLVPDGPLVRRRQIVHCELSKQGKHWKIVSLKPIEFFAPAPLDK